MRTRTVVISAASIAAVALVFAACSETASPPTPDSLSPSFAKGGQPGKLKSVAVTPTSATVDVGGTVQLTATPNPANATTTFAWSSSNIAVATVSAAGLVTGVASGSATITASGGGKSASATVSVALPPPPTSEPQTLVGAGDIASCFSDGDRLTADVLETIPGTIFTTGDNAYPNGSMTDYTNCYGPSWGRAALKARTMPSPGNHEYQTSGAAGYFQYFGSNAGAPGKGYYSYNLGEWHIIVLNSNSSCSTISCAAGSAQEQWLRADLAAHKNYACTLAYWHHPRFNSGQEHGNNTNVTPLWNALYENNADVILNGHEHVYERFAPQTPNGAADNARGIRQFTIGSGGNGHYAFKATPEPNSEARNNTAYGVLKLTLRTGGYDWQFVSAAGSNYSDTGSGTCH
jgi:hypothetical protein